MLDDTVRGPDPAEEALALLAPEPSARPVDPAGVEPVEEAASAEASRASRPSVMSEFAPKSLPLPWFSRTSPTISVQGSSRAVFGVGTTVVRRSTARMSLRQRMN